MPATEQTARDTKLLHLIFGITGVGLLLSTFWLLADDHSRQWKGYQRQYIAMSNRTGQWEEIALRDEVLATNAELQGKLQEARASVPTADTIDTFKSLMGDDGSPEDIQSEYDELQSLAKELGNIDREDSPAEFDDAMSDLTDARNDLLAEMKSVVDDAKFVEDTLLGQRKFASADLDAVKSQVGIAVRDGKPTAELDIRAEQQRQVVADLNLKYQAAAKKRKQLQEIVSSVEQPVEDIRKLVEKNEAELNRIEGAIEDRTSNFFVSSFPYLGKRWLELPILDAFNSPRKIDNLWTDNLTIDYNFRRVRRFDRCTTCHQGIDKTNGYVPEHELIVSIATPDEAPSNGNSGVEATYGVQLGDVSLTGANEVTVHAVTPNSPAATANVSQSATESEKFSPEELSSKVSNPYRTDIGNDVSPGLQPGDVIVRIGDNSITTLPQAKRLLSESVEWGKPLQLTIRRGAPQPFTSHPRLDLYLSSLSPHPMSVFGCTSCHEGQGNATDFKWASHAPNTLSQRTEWMEDYGWFNNHHWIYPMYPARFAESGCLKCHHNVTELAASEKFPEAPAPKLTQGHHLILKYGCFGCHEINGYNGDERIGPDMRLEPNYYAAALALKAEENFDDLPEDIKQLSMELGEHPERTAARHRLADWLHRDQKSKEPILSVDATRLADVLADVENPGQLRKVGPSLRYAADKLDEAFLYDWLENPRDFRPSTRMPRFFGLNAHLEEHDDGAHEDNEELPPPEDPVEAFNQLAPIHKAEQLQPIEILAISTYLLDRSQQYEFAKPAEGMESGTPEEQIARGKLLFELRGCLACHNHADFPNADSYRPADQVPPGPDLTGIGSKLDPERNPHAQEWLYSWIKNPSSYNPRTIMPDLKLAPIRHAKPTDNAGATEGSEATETGAEPEYFYTDPVADITAYLMSSKSEAWTAEQSLQLPLESNQQIALKALALEFLEGSFYVVDAEGYYEQGIAAEDLDLDSIRGAEAEMIVANKGEMNDRQRLLYVGRKAIGKYGCYACHDIPGFEDAKPIGAALADWGRKDPSKLAFEHISQYLSHGHGGGSHGDHEDADHDSDHAEAEDDAEHKIYDYEHGGEGLDEYFHHELEGHSRAGFIYQKLREPRSYDYHKAAEKGYNEWLRMPLFPFDHDEREAVITFVLGLVADPPAPEFVYTPDERALALIEGKQVLEKYNCGGCHMLSVEEWDIAYKPGSFPLTPEGPTYPFMDAHFPPELIAKSTEDAVDEAGLLHATLVGLPDIDPAKATPLIESEFEGEILPAEQDERLTPANAYYRFQLWKSMPIDGQVAQVGSEISVRGQMITEKRAPYGGQLTRYLLPRVAEIEKAANPNAAADQAYGWLPPPLVNQGNKTQGDWLFNFLLDPHTIRPAVFLQMPKFNMSPEESRKLVNYFAARDDANFPYEYQPSQRPEYLAKLEQAYDARYSDSEGDKSPDSNEQPLVEPVSVDSDNTRLDAAMRIVVNGNYCVTCHLVGDFEPAGSDRAKAPNLAEVHKRLRHDYVYPWIANPKRILPYTGMPVNIPYSADAEHLGGIPQDIYHGTSVQQLRGLTDLLMNYDRYVKQQTDIADFVKKIAAENKRQTESAAGAATENDTNETPAATSDANP